MLTRMYNKIFGGDGSAFNSEKNYYIEILNFAGDASYAELMRTSVDHYIGRFFYENKEVNPQDIDSDDFGNFLRANRNRLKFDVCYVLLFDYNDKNIGNDVSHAANAILRYKALKSNDRLIVILTLPDDDRKSVSYLASLEKADIPDIATVYFLVKSRYEEKQLMDNMCGVLIMNSNKEQHIKIEQNRRETNVKIENTIITFPEKGQEQFAHRNKVFWSTVSALYSDEKMDFLQLYIYNLCKNALDITSLDIKKLCGDFFAKQVAINDIEGCARKLSYAVNMIPRMRNVKVDYDLSLDRYFDQMYGSYGTQGIDVVELTLKVNLSRLPSYTNTIIEDAAKLLFDEAKTFHSSDIFSDLTALLESYVDEISDQISAKRNYLSAYIYRDGSSEENIYEYIKQYIKYSDELRKKVFFTDVLEYIKSNRTRFSKEIKASQDMMNQLEELKKELMFLENVKTGIFTFPQYSIEKILNADNDSDFCELLREEFDKMQNHKKIENRSGTPLQYAIDAIFDVEPFYSDYEYSFTVRGTYTVDIKQRFGTYCVFRYE